MALATGDADQPLDLTGQWVGIFAIAVFVLAYMLVMTEEFTHLRKSKPVIIAAGLIWGLIAWKSTQSGLGHAAEAAARHNLLEYAELMLFLLVAMTYINAMDERNVFEALRSWLVRKGFGFRKLFWVTGLLAFYQVFHYQTIVIIHMWTGAIFLAMVPFTRIAHMLFFPVTRAYMGSEFGKVRHARDW